VPSPTGAGVTPQTRQPLFASIWLLTDLAKQGWALRVHDAHVEIRRLLAPTSAACDERGRIRRDFTPPVRSSCGDSGPDVIRDLRDPPTPRYALRLDLFPYEGPAPSSLKSFTPSGGTSSGRCGDPSYLQIIDGDERCIHTGLRLTTFGDTSAYLSLLSEHSRPLDDGSLCAMRQRRPPVIGIAAVVARGRHHARDEAIGWTPKEFVAALQRRPRESLPLDPAHT